MRVHHIIIKIIMPILQALFENRIYTINNGLSKGLKRRGGLGFFPQVTGLTKEENFLMSLELKEKTVYDVGGYIGITTMFFARAVGARGKVVTFEPNPDNFYKIEENIRLNKFSNVKVINLALGKQRDKAQLIVDNDDDSGTGQIQGKTLSGKEHDMHLTIMDVEIDYLDDVIISHHLPIPFLIKIDVEGFEMDVLLGMRETIINHKPQLFIEIHGSDTQGKIDNIKGIVDFLSNHGYSIYHVESRSVIYRTNAETACRGHIYCS